MCVGKNKNNFSGCFLLNFPKFRFKTAVKIGLQVTGNVLLKCGLLHLKFLLKTARSKKCFPLTKLIKKWRRKHFLRLNFTKFSTQEPSIPHFSNTMLCDVAIFHNFFSVRFSFQKFHSATFSKFSVSFKTQARTYSHS